MPSYKVLRNLAVWVLLIGIVCGIILVSLAGKLLVVDNPQRADVIVVLAGDFRDVRSQHALKLFREGYAPELVLDAPDWMVFGRTASDLAREYLKVSIPNKTAQLHVCNFKGDSTLLELREVAPCIQTSAPGAASVLLVTSNFHTRRSLSIAQHILPQYKWSAAAAPDERFNTAWWRNREAAKTMLAEWQKLCWWMLVEKWFVRC